MGGFNSKTVSEDDLSPAPVFSSIMQTMFDRVNDSLKQFKKWEELGFPKDGSFSLRQLDALKLKMIEKEKTDTAAHYIFSKKQQAREKQSIPDWRVYCVWREEAELRE